MNEQEKYVNNLLEKKEYKQTKYRYVIAILFTFCNICAAFL